MKKVLSLLLVTLLLVAAVPVFADDAVAVQPGDKKVILSFNEKSDVTILYHKWLSTSMTESEANSNYTMYSNYSAYWYTSGAYLNYKLDMEDAVDVQGYDYINFVVYSDSDISMPGDFYFGPTGTMNYWFSAFAGKWTVQSIPLSTWITQAAVENGGYRGFCMHTDPASVIPTGRGYANEGMATNAQPKAKSAKIYLDSIFVSKGLPTAPAVTGTSIANGATGISRNLDKYVVTFDSAMNAKSFTAETLTVKETATGTPVTVKSVNATGNTATIAFNEGSLALGTEYTVTVSDGVYNAYGLALAADATFTFTTSPYAVTGIYANENVLMNIGGARNRVRTVGINTTENVAKVVYKLDGVEAATVTAAPFTWDMPLDAVASHSLSAVVYDAADAAYEAAGVNFKVMYENPVAFISDDFEGTIGEDISIGSGHALTYQTLDKDADGVPSIPRGTVTYAADPAGVKEGTVLKSVATVSGADHAIGFNVTKPASKVVQFDFDIYVNQESYTYMRIDKHSVYAETATCIQPYHLYNNADKVAFKPGTAWNHVTVIMDFIAPRYEVYVNGAFHKSGVLHNNYVISSAFGVVFPTRSTFYLDNLRVQTLEELTASDAMLDAATFTATEDGWDADVTIANFANVAKEYTVLTAVYDASGNVIAVDKQVVNAPADEISTTEYTVAKTRGDKTGAKVRAFVWESVEGVLTLRPIAEIK